MLIPQVFRDLRSQIESLVSRLSETKPDQLELIHDELRNFFAELDSIWACRLVESHEVSLRSEASGYGRFPDTSTIRPTSETTYIGNDREDPQTCCAIVAGSSSLPSSRALGDPLATSTLSHSSSHGFEPDASVERDSGVGPFLVAVSLQSPQINLLAACKVKHSLTYRILNLRSFYKQC